MNNHNYYWSLLNHLLNLRDIDNVFLLIIVLVVIALLLIILVIAIINLNKSKEKRNMHQIVDIENDMMNDELVRIIASQEYLNKKPSDDNISEKGE